MLSSIISTTLLTTNTSLINLLAATATLALGVIILLHDKKREVNQLAFLVALFLSFWVFSSTLADVMHQMGPALFWARTAIIGPFYFAALVLIFSYRFPEPGRTLPTWKAMCIMAPSLAILPFVMTDLNVASVRLEDWGTDFTPGILYVLGLPYGIAYLVFAAVNFWRARRQTDDQLKRSQIKIVFFAVGIVIVSLITTNVILPLAFGYTKASVFGPIASLVFLVLMSYAIYAKGAMDVKVIATEFFSYLLIFVAAAQALVSDTIQSATRNVLILLLIVPLAILLIRSVRAEVRRREELQILSDQLAAANEHLKEMDQLKSEFISIASHQLRTPISVVKGYLSLMIDGAYGQLTDALHAKAEQMYEMNERLVLMVSNMLNVTRIEKHRLEFMCATADVARIVNDAVEEMRLKAKQKGITVTFVDAPEDPLVAFVDKEKVHETLTNLLDNALKYSQKGQVEVRAVPHRKGKEVLVTVKDSGVGMTKEEAERLFAKFFRAGAGQITHEQGTGLGLYVCKMFVEGMGGKIWIDRTEPGKGTTFAFVLPTEPKQECVKPRKTPVSA